MKALYFLNFWRATAPEEHRVSGRNDVNGEISSAVVYSEDEFDEGEDSFFELELTVSDYDYNVINNQNGVPPDKESNKFDFKHEASRKSADKCSKPALSLSHTDHVSKRKILPFEPFLKPQSPISLLKSAPKFRVLMFKKSKSMTVQKTEETEWNSVFVDTQNPNKKGSKRFMVKLKLEESVTRDNSLRRQILEDSVSDDSSSLFSKDAIQKYLKLIKPLYTKLSKKQSEKMKLSGQLSTSSASSMPAGCATGSLKIKHGNPPLGIGAVGKHLGKSKSSSSTVGVSPSTVSRRDDSLLLQDDGIQSAIQHCKRSFNSSRETSESPRISTIWDQTTIWKQET
ncbi:hypothetical protein K2173_008621 [Erythroxylum novogranatense]|uniref:Membrane-associated kinase regulator 5 n=1 Tax=Erythroxylum novogranatense TaxID=1862640 RepID=A0AAV8SKT1_9ROSI|nr:hypothetical protein K2173_008621 [Erythroxylum novogranatense]